MNSNNFDVHKALADISLIRRALDHADQDQIDTRLVGVTLDANLLLQSAAFLAALALCMTEIFSGNSVTQTLMMSSEVDELRHFGIGFMAAILIGLLVALYFILWRAALHNNESMGAYITRNFKYVKNLSLISDLLMKFITISLLLLAGKAEWVAPVLMAFTGDYLLQGRFFTLPTKTSVVLGIGCLVAAFAQFIIGSHALLFPLLVFSFIAGVSTARLAVRYRQQKTVAA